MINKFFKQKYIIIVFLFLLFLFQSNNVYSVDIVEPKNVLIINSYHQGFSWSKDEMDGIIDTLKKDKNIPNIFVEYMDWKNYPTNDNILLLYDYFKYKYQKKYIDILIVTDDSALQFALKYRESIFSNAPIVFCGVNQKGVSSITSGYKNLTGIIEVVDPTETIKMALKINPAIKNVYILFDNSESGLSTGILVDDKIKSMYSNLNTIPLNNLSYDELIDNVKNFDSDSIILVTTYYSDVNGRIVEFENVSREISKNSNVPVYHLYDLGLNNGALGGNMVSGKLQGMSAANLAIRILNGENPEDIPVHALHTTRNVFDFQQLKRFDIPLSLIPEDCEIINKPFSFFETYKTLVLTVLTAFIILICFVLILLIHIKQIRRMEKILSDSNNELTQIYEELATSDEELQQQYNEVLKNNELIRISEEKLAYLAFHDRLTGLPNKLSLFENSNNNVLLPDSITAILFADMDNFKYINDTMGHSFGDQLIISVSERLVSLLGKGSFVYKLGGDEFIIILQNTSKSEAERFASHILAEFKAEFVIYESIIHVNLSIAIVMYPEHGNNIGELLKYADIAMYRAKDEGRNRYVVYDQLMNEAFTQRVNIERYLRTALEKNEFEIFYQPQLDLKSNKITGIEALLRWKNSELGSVSVNSFIKVAEDTHLIIPLGAWVLRSACGFLKKLHSNGYTDLTVSVNISMLQLLQTNFTDIVIDTLEFFELKPECLELEITESILMESYETIGDKLEKLRKSGVKIALDDFGRGYSSLAYLKQLPISTLKIDKSFIDDISCEKSDESLTGQIVVLGKSMGKCVIAEGVENLVQYEYLVKHECNKMQGYLCSKPIPGNELERLLKHQLY